MMATDVKHAPRAAVGDWPTSTLEGVIFTMRRRAREEPFADTRLIVFRADGQTCCGLAAGSEISVIWRTACRYPTSETIIRDELISDPRVVAPIPGRDDLLRLRTDLIVSTPKLAATLVLGQTSRGGIWQTPGQCRLLDDLDLTFRSRFNSVRFTHDGTLHVIDQFGRTTT